MKFTLYTSSLIPNEEKPCIQPVVGIFLYYSRAVDSTILDVLGTIADNPAKSTEATAKSIIQLMGYCDPHPNATMHYKSSGMVLRVHSDRSYL